MVQDGPTMNLPLTLPLSVGPFPLLQATLLSLLSLTTANILSPTSHHSNISASTNARNPECPHLTTGSRPYSRLTTGSSKPSCSHTQTATQVFPTSTASLGPPRFDHWASQKIITLDVVALSSSTTS